MIDKSQLEKINLATMWIVDISPTNFRTDNFYAEYEIDKKQLVILEEL